MSTNTPADVNHTNGGTAEVTDSTTGMHRPGHSVLDTEETAGLDEVLRESALRDSAVRMPR
ncbi:hypothetical protein EC912_101153 [Luteibacter rhizovicinus]|uniref:Uncharacterized protein n=1 Tax=Luteibacter rhizovicinus TaxID=242606 RepID=A0A4R3YZ50_9GAMM|nr:hypothetical protein [Luteibacter rhizovicinus]TCV97158.1 hypothetical protein EC912_101153 [Luteibacter rhizovicinus]